MALAERSCLEQGIVHASNRLIIESSDRLAGCTDADHVGAAAQSAIAAFLP